MTGRPWRAAKDGLLVSVRVTPRGGRDAWGVGAPEHFAVRVATAPTDGSANDAVRALAARHFAVSRGAVTIHSGETARVKRLHVAGDPQMLAERAAALYEAAP